LIAVKYITHSFSTPS